MTARRWAGALGAVALLAAACVHGKVELSVSPGSSPVGHPTAPPTQDDPLCKPSPSGGGRPQPSGGSLPPDIAKVAGQVEEVRGLTFERPIVPEPLTQQQMQQQLQDSLQQQVPAGLAAREGKTLITIGAVPAGTDLHQVVIDY